MNDKRSVFTMVAAAGFSLVYLVAFGFMMWHFALPDKPEGNWERALVLFNGIASVGLTAVGVLLGTTVQQTNVQNARKDATEAKSNEERLKQGIKDTLNADGGELGGRRG